MVCATPWIPKHENENIAAYSTIFWSGQYSVQHPPFKIALSATLFPFSTAKAACDIASYSGQYSVQHLRVEATLSATLFPFSTAKAACDISSYSGQCSVQHLRVEATLSATLFPLSSALSKQHIQRKLSPYMPLGIERNLYSNETKRSLLIY